MDLHIILGLLIPVVFLGFAGMVKCLVKKSWTWGNFYLGVDISLAALANGIVNVVDLAHKQEFDPVSPRIFGNQMGLTALCIVVAVLALFSTMGLHQQFDLSGSEGNGNRRIRRGILLGVVGNLFGATVLGVFIFWKLRGLI